jgi:hypothetical protein
VEYYYDGTLKSYQAISEFQGLNPGKPRHGKADLTHRLVEFSKKSNSHVIYAHYCLDVSPQNMYGNPLGEDLEKMVNYGKLHAADLPSSKYY